MPTVEVGGKIIEFPEGTTPEQMKAALEKNKPKLDLSVASVLQQVGQGLTFGLYDEILGAQRGGIRSATEDVPFSQAYEEERDRARAADTEFGQAAPLTRETLRAGGGLLTGAGTAKASQEVLKRLPGLQNIPRFARYGVAGGAGGAAAGAGFSEGETAGDVAKDTAAGGLVGAMFGVGVPALAELGGKGYQALRGQIQNYLNPKQAASRKLVEAMIRDETTPQRMMARAATLGPRSTVADAGGVNVRRLAETVANRPGKAANIAERTMGKRVLTQADTLADAVDDNLTKTGFFTARAGRTQARAKAANQAYQAAYEAKPVLESQRIKNLLENPAVKRAVKDARLNPNLKDLPDNSIEMLDAAYKEIGKRARAPEAPYALKQLRKELLDAIADENPVYRKTVTDFAEESAIIDAMDEGRKIFRLRPEEIKMALSELGDDGIEAFRIGAADAIKDKIAGRSDTANAVRSVANSPKMRAQLEAVFPDTKSYRMFLRELMRESKMFDTATDVLKNSRTAQRMASEADFGLTPGAMVDTATGNKVGLLARALGGVDEFMRRQPEGVANELAPVLFRQNPAQAATQLQSGVSNEVARRAINQRLLEAIAGVSGIQGGRAAPYSNQTP